MTQKLCSVCDTEMKILFRPDWYFCGVCTNHEAEDWNESITKNFEYKNTRIREANALNIQSKGMLCVACITWYPQGTAICTTCNYTLIPFDTQLTELKEDYLQELKTHI